jgi:hypothetical protein
MSENPPSDKVALLMAEEVLRTIYGDDLKGCAVSLESIAGIMMEGLKQRESQTQGLLDLYDKVVEAMLVLSTPPDTTKVTDPKQLRSLLSERLDAIYTVAKKTRDTTAFIKVARSPEQSGGSPV